MRIAVYRYKLSFSNKFEIIFIGFKIKLGLVTRRAMKKVMLNEDVHG